MGVFANTHPYRGVGEGLAPPRFPGFALPPWQRSVPRQAGKPAPETLEEDDPSRREPIRCTLPLTISTPSDIVSPSKWRGRRRAEISSCPERDVFGASILQLPSAVPLPSCPGHDRDGTLPLQRTQAARCRALLAIRVEPWDHQFDLYASPLNISQGWGFFDAFAPKNQTGGLFHERRKESVYL